MDRTVRLVDDSVKDEILRYPTVAMIRKLFPDVRMRGRSVMCNPLRGERNASLSCFIDRYGYPRWKDHATGESGDNIDFFRRAYPELDYSDAVDRLSWIVLGRSALLDVDPLKSRPSFAPPRRRPVHVQVKEPESALKIMTVSPLVPGACSEGLVTYWRGRGISDLVAGTYCRRVVFQNVNRTKNVLIDGSSGLPIYGKDGEPVHDDGLNEAVGLPNDIGEFSLRVPDRPGEKSFKPSSKQFVSTIYADGSSRRGRVSFFGEGEGLVEGFWYDASRKLLYVNHAQGFCGVEPWAARFVLPYLDGWRGRYLEGRERTDTVAVIDVMNGPVNRVAVVVEGMFDALSVIELEKLAGRGPVPGVDLVVLNSIGNLPKAVPFLSMHSEVRSLLDNDMRSAAGQKAFTVMQESVSSYSGRCGAVSMVVSHSGFFYPYKDVNDYLRKSRGFDVPVPGTVDGEKKNEVTDAALRRPGSPSVKDDGKKKNGITF